MHRTFAVIGEPGVIDEFGRIERWLHGEHAPVSADSPATVNLSVAGLPSGANRPRSRRRRCRSGSSTRNLATTSTTPAGSYTRPSRAPAAASRTPPTRRVRSPVPRSRSTPLTGEPGAERTTPDRGHQLRNVNEMLCCRTPGSRRIMLVQFPVDDPGRMSAQRPGSPVKVVERDRGTGDRSSVACGVREAAAGARDGQRVGASGVVEVSRDSESRSPSDDRRRRERGGRPEGSPPPLRFTVAANPPHW